MLIRYNDVDLLPGDTAEFHIRPVYDESGLDVLYQEATLSTVCVWSPKMTAANRIPASDEFPDYTGIGQGTVPLPVTHYSLRQRLMEPRRRLLVMLGKGRIYSAPRLWSGPPPAGVTAKGELQCDPSGGPFPQDVRVDSVLGDKAAIVYFRIKFAFSNFNKVVASHRWSSSRGVDASDFATRRIEGVAHFRLDELEKAIDTPRPAHVPVGRSRLYADDFLDGFNHPVPVGFVRRSVNVRVSEDGSKLSYTVEDREVAKTLGVTSSAYKLEGNVTVGGEKWLPSLQALPTEALKYASFLGAWAASTTASKIRGVVRAFGRKNASRFDLLSLCVETLYDRLNKAGKGKDDWWTSIYPVSFYVTQDLSAGEGSSPPMIEVRAEFLPGIATELKTMFSDTTAATTLMDLSSNVLTTDAPNYAQKSPASFPDWGSPNLNMRGSYLGAMIGQVLQYPPDTVSAPPAVGNALKVR